MTHDRPHPDRAPRRGADHPHEPAGQEERHHPRHVCRDGRRARRRRRRPGGARATSSSACPAPSRPATTLPISWRSRWAARAARRSAISCWRWPSAQKPIVSGVDGIAVGIGTTINLHCDLTFATPRTEFRTPFVDLGAGAGSGSSLLVPTVIGHQRAFALLGLGEPLSAERALAAGLIYAVVPEDALEAETLAAAENIAAKPPEALRIARDLMRGPRDALVARISEEAEHFRARLKSDEARAAFAAFLARKKPG